MSANEAYLDATSATTEALRASELQYRRLFESARDGILILNAETGMIMDVNPFLVELLGISRETFLGKKVWQLGFLKDIVANEDKFTELQAQKYIRYEDLPLETADGRPIAVEFVSNVYLVNGDRVIQCNIRDITERKRAEEALRRSAEELARSNEDLEQFARIASHDLQEPLRAVCGFLKLLQERYEPQLDDEAKELIGCSVEGATRMSQLISDLLAYSRVDRKGKEARPTDAGKALIAAMANLHGSIQEAGVTVIHEELPMVQADSLQLLQLFQNLIGNAIKFRSPDRPCQVHINARAECGQWLFSVRDNGIGIPREAFERVFVIFQRLHIRKKYTGTGIGLAICKKIVERHGGRIWIESKVGEETTFYFTLPAARSA
jgi:PAS domain S-box-containing protein